eukprot:SAG11_NODE_3032_length_2749_cov_8.088679_1_plen_62_part_00
MWTGGGAKGPGVGWDIATDLNETTDAHGNIGIAHGFHKVFCQHVYKMILSCVSIAAFVAVS